MNVFSKEELQLILEDIDDLRFSKFYRIDNVELRKKVQNMIDNYCDHDWDNSCCGCPLESIYCEKCDRKLNDNQ